MRNAMSLVHLRRGLGRIPVCIRTAVSRLKLAGFRMFSFPAGRTKKEAQDAYVSM